MRWRFVLSEMSTGLRRNLSMTVASILTVAISMTALGAAWLMHAQINTMKDFWFGKIQVSVFLTKDVTQPERDAIRTQLEQLPQVQHVYYENKQQAYQHFVQQFHSVQALVKNTDPSALPESYRVKLKDPKQYAVVASAVQNLPGVDQVADESAVLKKFFHILDGIERFFLFVAVAVLIATVLLIYNTVRLSAFSRRRETGIMRLVGASDLYIQGPFVLETVSSAMVGGLVATGMLFLAKVVVIDHGLKGSFGTVVAYIGWGTVAATVPFIFLLCILIAAVTSFGTLQRYLRV